MIQGAQKPDEDPLILLKVGTYKNAFFLTIVEPLHDDNPWDRGKWALSGSYGEVGA